MNPSQGQFANVVNLEQKRIEKNQNAMAARSPFGPIQSKLVKPVTDSPAEESQLAEPSHEAK